jgi:hypothetical protein
VLAKCRSCTIIVHGIIIAINRDKRHVGSERLVARGAADSAAAFWRESESQPSRSASHRDAFASRRVFQELCILLRQIILQPPLPPPRSHHREFSRNESRSHAPSMPDLVRDEFLQIHSNGIARGIRSLNAMHKYPA